MAILNITYQGQSADYELELDFAASDADIRRIAVEVVRSGGVRGLHAGAGEGRPRQKKDEENSLHVRARPLRATRFRS